jgi:hypothetical protein
MLFGIAAVLPWNIIVAAIDIFETKVMSLFACYALNLIFYIAN